MANINVGTILRVDVGNWARDDEYLCYPIARTWQWTRDNVDIPGAVSGTYTTSNSDIGKTIRVKETTRFLGENNNGYTVESSSPSTTASSDGHLVGGSAIPTLVFQENLTYLGAINVSNVTSYGGLGIAFNPSGTGSQKTFIAGGSGNTFRQGQEFTLPAPSLATTDFNTAGFPKATTLGTVNTDITEGGWDQPSSPLGNWGSLLPEMRGKHHIPGTTKMLMTADIRYQNEQPYACFWRRPWSLSTTGQVEGPVAVYDLNYAPRANTGWICNIPSTPVGGVNYQTALGADMLTGLSGLSIAGNASSRSPSISAFSMADFDAALLRKFSGTATAHTGAVPPGAPPAPHTITLGTEADGKTILAGDWIHCSAIQTTSAVRITAYNSVTRVVTVAGTPFISTATGPRNYTFIPRAICKQLSYRDYLTPFDDATGGYSPVGDFPGIYGAVIPNGTKSLLCFGTNGDGKYSYGEPGDYNDGNTLKIWDPESNVKGGHAYPTFGKIWAYNLDELVQVKNGTGGYTPENIKPYGVWNLPQPALATMRYIRTSGVTYDPSTQRIYIIGSYPEQEGNPYGPSVVHVFQVTNAV